MSSDGDNNDYEVMMRAYSQLRRRTSGMITTTRNRIKGHIDLYNNYFKANPLYHVDYFVSLRMRRHLFFHNGGCEGI